MKYEVDPVTGCWIFLGTKTPTGYGMYHAPGARQSRSAHRFMYESVHGAIPPGLELDHLCRVRACVNPAHLEPVTHTENMRRGAPTKLTSADVAQIKARPDEDRTVLAQEFGVSRNAIWAITTGRTWADIEPAA